jgi:hypothetical protein
MIYKTKSALCTASVLILLCAFACGGSTGTGVSSSGGGSSSGGTSGVCPANSPEANSTCSRDGQVCEYGNNPKCLGRATCTSGKWSVTAAKCLATDPSCPATREAAAGKVCTSKDVSCNYEGLTCNCTNCTEYPVVQCGGDLTWRCDAPNQTPGCPAARPNAGLACTSAGLFCDYGCENNASRKCTDGAWTPASSFGGCPQSTAEVKERIRYLSETDRASVAEQTRAIKLSTWHYKDPAIATRERLGYILEDAPGLPSSDMARKEVDLYGYTSMVLALAQEQDRELRELRAKVNELDKRLPKTASKSK